MNTRLVNMLRGGQIRESNLWIDAYNQTTGEIAGTILTRVDKSNHYWVSVEK